ncbi:MAG: DUF115 domain-containing protein [Methanosarcinaceae archaeon]|nr:DUF115 domain-containing protein [Methanosarcinaceae archaeon]
MDFDLWEPIYLQILDDFGFSREEDERAAIILSEILTDANSVGTPVLAELVQGKDVLICGNAPVLPDDLKLIDPKDYVIIAADGATAVLVDTGIIPDIIVTDLDGDIEKEIIANQKGAIAVVHAHGDNIDKLEKYVPRLKDIIGTTQSKPLNDIHNFGGFTDGDRCVYLAKEFNAASITIIGFDLEDTDVSPMKKKKLKWARWLIDEL